MKKATILVSVLAYQSSNAAVLLWSDVDWNQSIPTSSGNAVMSQTYNNVDNSDVDVTVSITAGPNTTTGTTGEITRIDATRDTITNGSDSKESLMIDANFGSTSNNDYIIVTVSFSKAVSNVSLDLWDIDYGNNNAFWSPNSIFRDVISDIQANSSAPEELSLLAEGDDVGATSNTLFGTSSAGNSGSGFFGPYGNENDESDSGYGVIGFGSQSVTSVSFKYSSDIGDNGDPTVQRIGVADIKFTEPEPTSVPEPTSSCLLLSGAFSLIFRRRRQ